MNVRSPAGDRCHRQRQQERRKTRRWRKAWAELDDPISLVLDAGGAGKTPIMWLPLPLLKSRIQDLNVALELARHPCDGAATTADEPRAVVHPAAPEITKHKHVLSLDAFERLHEHGHREYEILACRGVLAPAVGACWAFVRHADLAAALPEITPSGGRRRTRYLVRIVRDERGGIAAIQVFSVNYMPILELRICPPALVQQEAQAAI